MTGKLDFLLFILIGSCQPKVTAKTHEEHTSKNQAKEEEYTWNREGCTSEDMIEPLGTAVPDAKYTYNI